MQKFIFWLIYSLMYLVSLLPFFILFRLSDLFYILVYYIFRYRRHVVFQNLSNAFPHNSEQEIHQISRDYYKYFCDLLLEVVSLLSLSRKEIVKRCAVDSDSLYLMQQLYQAKSNVILLTGHRGNWELNNHSFNAQFKNQLYPIYKPLFNKYFDKLILRLRSRWGSILVPIDEAYHQMSAYQKAGNVTVFLADQSPDPKTAHWTTFLNQDTPVFRGTEIIARRLDYPVVYLSTKRIKRGYYKFSIEMLCEHPRAAKKGEITEAYINRLECDIQTQPEIWLWSHRRWKHTKPRIMKTMHSFKREAKVSVI